MRYDPKADFAEALEKELVVKQLEVFTNVRRYIKLKNPQYKDFTVHDIFVQAINKSKGTMEVTVYNPAKQYNTHLGTVFVGGYDKFTVDVDILDGDKLDKLEIEVLKHSKENFRYTKLRKEFDDLEKKFSLLQKQLNPKKDIKTEGVNISPRDFKDEIE